jgi:hypothetical protein
MMKKCDEVIRAELRQLNTFTVGAQEKFYESLDEIVHTD